MANELPYQTGGGAEVIDISQSGGIHLPGSRACTYVGQSQFHSLLRQLTSAKCRLGSFARSFCCRHFNRDRHGTAFKSLYPMPLPYPEALARGNSDRGDVLSLKRGVCSVVIVLNFVFLGRPRHCSEELRINRPLNKMQWDGIRRMEHLMRAWIDVSPIDAEAMGRTAAKIESLEETLSGLEAAASYLAQDGRGYFVSKSSTSNCGRPGGAQRGADLGRWAGGDEFSTFKEIDPSRLSFVGTPSFNPSPYLDELSRKIFEDPIQTRDDPDHYVGKKPQLKVHCSLAQKIRLFELLDSSGRLGLHRPCEVRADFGSGLFAVVKDMVKDRLILDSRGANLLERPAQRWIQSLACGESLVKLLLQNDKVIKTSGNDLRDFYYLFSASESRSIRNVLVGPLHASRIAHLHAATKKGYTDGMVFGSLRTLAMGDCQAVELAQTCHLSLALNAGVSKKENLISMHQPLPRSTSMTGLVIDDFITLSFVGRECGEDQSEGAQMADQMYQKYEEVKLIPNQKKSFRDQTHSSFWGVDLDGKHLLIIAVLTPLAVTNLRAPVARRITATDASNWGEAAVTAPLPEKIAEEVYRHTLKKSLWVRLLGPSAAWRRMHSMLDPAEEVPEPGTEYKSHPLWETLAKTLEYHLVFRRQRKGARHINVGELRAMLAAEEKLALTEPSHRQMFGLDSQVGLGAAVKGRSSSRALNAEMVQSLPIVLLQDVYSEFLYFETSSNPADDPTRGKEVRPPCCPAPPWWRSLELGECEEFDEWMRDKGVHPDTVGRLPDFSELLHGSLHEEAVRKELSSLHRKVDVFEDRGGHVLNEDEELFRHLDAAEDENTEDESTEAEILASAFTEAEVSEAEIGGAEGTGSLGVGGAKAQPERREEKACSHLEEPSEPRFPGEALSKKALEILEEIPRDQFVGLKAGPMRAQGRGFLDLFAGERGVAECLHRLTGRWVLCYDISHSPAEDLSDPKVQRRVEVLLEEKAVLGVGGGPVCGSFSMAVTPPVRSHLYPYGKPDVSANMKEKIKLGNLFARWMIKILRLGIANGLGVWLENPSSSWMFRLPVWRRLLEEEPSLGRWLVDYCRYFKRWRKRTAVFSNTCLSGHRTLCRGGHVHQLLRGRCQKERKAWTAVAQSYPKGVAYAIAAGLSMKSELISWRGDFDPAQCARAGHLRIGEAKNPGPRMQREREGDLRRIHLVEAKTLALQDRAWCGFRSWVTELFSVGAVRSAMSHPGLLAALLEEFGYSSFTEGRSLFMYRHLIVYVQQQLPETKLHLGRCWDTIAKWEISEPVEHRVPLPFAIYSAMLSVALSWGWRAFACILGISFLGIARPGEPLNALRSDLVLPSDRMQVGSDTAYLRVGRAKSRRRGKGAVQHLTITDEVFVQFLERTVGSLPGNVKLFSGSHSVFRRRWDAVLRALKIGRDTNLTPGGLRGGGCVHSFQSGSSIQLLMWRMRLKHQITLESYLQEVVASSVLATVSPEARSRISAMSSITLWLLQL